VSVEVHEGKTTQSPCGQNLELLALVVCSVSLVGRCLKSLRLSVTRKSRINRLNEKTVPDGEDNSSGSSINGEE
jgi:hypothetical protein